MRLGDVSSKLGMSLLIPPTINRSDVTAHRLTLPAEDCLLKHCPISDVIGNLTALQTLDLSHNDINDISDRDVFLPPLNLTNLHLSNNHLSHVPLDKILSLPNLKVLNLEENEIGVFDEKFMKIIQNGTMLRYSGNNRLNN